MTALLSGVDMCIPEACRDPLSQGSTLACLEHDYIFLLLLSLLCRSCMSVTHGESNRGNRGLAPQRKANAQQRTQHSYDQPGLS